ncbi:Di-copper centre-containing protein, partial [Neoconidiobolus thromboides FSU 785]
MKYFLIVNLFAGLILTQATGRCEKIHVRKEIRDLTSQEREDFFNAILSINSGSRPTPLDRLTRIHVDNSDSIHTNPVFLPWHRHFLHLAEQEMRKNYPNLVIPYWDWARDSQAPERSEIFTDNYFGGTGTAQTNWCVSSGRFKDFRVITTDDGNQEHCLRRSFNKGNRISAFVSVEGIDKVKRENKNYDRFAQRLEGSPHALPHTFIGGDYGDISSMSSPNDPIFWVHHGMIDKIWADWQVENGEEGKKY